MSVSLEWYFFDLIYIKYTIIKINMYKSLYHILRQRPYKSLMQIEVKTL